MTEKREMKAHERFACLFNGQTPDRLPAIEWAPYWHLSINRWMSEGMPQQPDNLSIQRYFGLDGCVQIGFSPRNGNTPTPKSFGAGIVKSEAEYEAIKDTLYKDPAPFIGPELQNYLRKTRADGDVVHFFTVEGFFWMPRELLGIEEHLYSFYDQPELLHLMCEDYITWLHKVVETIGNISDFKFDFMSFAEDMSYNNGPMIGKDCFDEFLAPYYQRIIPEIKKLGVPVFIDSDGDITKAVDWYASVGASGMFPLERQAGVDVSTYVDKQPDMVFIGHFDKMCMKYGEQAMIKEFERLLPTLKKKRLVPSVDHQTPPDVSIENYRIYCRLLREYTAKALD